MILFADVTVTKWGRVLVKKKLLWVRWSKLPNLARGGFSLLLGMVIFRIPRILLFSSAVLLLTSSLSTEYCGAIMKYSVLEVRSTLNRNGARQEYAMVLRKDYENGKAGARCSENYSHLFVCGRLGLRLLFAT